MDYGDDFMGTLFVPGQARVHPCTMVNPALVTGGYTNVRSFSI